MKAEELIAHARGKACIGDSGNSSQAIIDAIRARGMKPVIAANPTHKNIKLRLDRKLHALSYRVECCVHALKRCRAVATRYDKTATSFLAAVQVACPWMWLVD